MTVQVVARVYVVVVSVGVGVAKHVKPKRDAAEHGEYAAGH